MNGSSTQFQQMLNAQVQKYRGVYVPVHSSLVRRAIIRFCSCKKLHPNPEDVFCDPKIGPRQEILSKYEKDFRMLRRDPIKDRYIDLEVLEPLIVERIRPDGYIILNGHHRWAAAMRAGKKRVKVHIVNLTQKMDIENMLRNAKHQKRVALDLDEVVLADKEDRNIEKPLPFPFGRIHPERLRLGIPALFRYLNKLGYDIWLYSEKYHSQDSIRRLFRLYQTQVTGIVTGTGRKNTRAVKSLHEAEKAVTQAYQLTVHIDRSSVLRIDNRTKEYSEISLPGTDGWSSEVIDILHAMDKEAEVVSRINA